MKVWAGLVSPEASPLACRLLSSPCVYMWAALHVYLGPDLIFL